MSLEIGPVSPTSAVERIAAAMEAAHAAAAQANETADVTQAATVRVETAAAAETRHPQTAETLLRGSFVERVLGEQAHSTSAAPADRPGERAGDRNIETSQLQTHARAAGVPERPATAAHAHALPTAANASDKFALPAALLVPATLIGLQVEAAAGWPLTQRPLHTDRAAPAAPEDEDRARFAHEQAARHDDEEAPDDEDPAAEAEDAQAAPACAHVFEAGGDDDWCEALSAALREALGSRVPPRALLLAAEQWQRGRCVVLACPQGFDAAGPAWAFVLWPDAPARRATGGQPAPLVLRGLRVDARLQWSTPARGPKWLHVRVIKEHHPRHGRQLIPNTPGSSGAVPCEVQLGPVLARTLRCCDVCVRIHAARRFWSALGQQWSMQVVVSSMPLLPAPGTAMDRSTEDA
jgi:hypothetical protein